MLAAAADDQNQASDRLPFEQHHAFIIGINAYEKVSSLQTAVADAEKLAEVLSQQQHFCVHPPLLNATGEQIRTLLKTLPQQVGKDDRVFFYFAGHGIAADGDDGPAGYIVPADADSRDPGTFIAMGDVQQALEKLPCRHLLLVLDCCFSGAFKWSSQHRAIGSLMPKRIYQERFDRFMTDPAWQVITSAAYDQKALDVLGGKATGDRGQDELNSRHSPFAKALFEGLAGKADVQVDGEGDGVITATELYAYIRDQVEPQSIEVNQRLRQTPGFFPLKKHDKGEFSFLHPRHRLNLPPRPNRSPYMGLGSFDEADAHLFYGRDRSIEELGEKADKRLVVVTGPSGAGKSSVVKAGLLPKLRKAGLGILSMRPGAHPVKALETALAAHKAEGSGKAVLLIDQFEEVITRCAEPEARDEFVKKLHGLVTQDSGLEQVVLTVRSDFEPSLAGLANGMLEALWTQGRYVVPPFSLEELKEVIVMPTMQEVLIFDPPELVDKIVGEVVQSAGALPLLSFALSELYEAYRSSGREDRALLKRDYEALGGVNGAMRKKADALYASLNKSQQGTMRKIMLRMVSVEGELASKCVPRDDLVYSEADEPLVDKVIEHLVEARLIVTGKDDIEPAHDALVRGWKTLHDWIHEVGREKLILGTKAGASANEFARIPHEGLLWNESPHLAALEEELRKPDCLFNVKEIAFIEQSAQRKHALSREREEQLEKIAEQQAARAKLQRRATQGLVGAAVVLVALLGWVLVQTREVASSRSLVMANAALAASDRSQGLRLGILATQSSWLEPANERAGRSLAALIYKDALIAKFAQHTDNIDSASFSRDGTRVVTGSWDNSARVWDATTGKQIGAKMDHKHWVMTASFNKDGTRVVTTDFDSKSAWLWDANTGKLVGEPLTHSAQVKSAFFSRDGMRVITASEDDTARLWDAATGRPDGPVIRHNGLWFASFSDDGSRVVTASTTDNTARVWDLESGEQIGLALKHEDSVGHASFNPAGTRVLTIELIGGDVRVWDATTGARVGKTMEHDRMLNFARFSPDGAQVLTGSDDNSARLWDAETGALLNESMSHESDVEFGSFSPDGRRVVTASGDGTARIWDASTGKQIGAEMSHFSLVSSASFSPDGKRVLTASWDGKAAVWDPTKLGVSSVPMLVASACSELRGEARKIKGSDSEAVGNLIPYEAQGNDVCTGGNRSPPNIFRPQTDRQVDLTMI